MFPFPLACRGDSLFLRPRDDFCSFPYRRFPSDASQEVGQRHVQITFELRIPSREKVRPDILTVSCPTV